MALETQFSIEVTCDGEGCFKEERSEVFHGRR